MLNRRSFMSSLPLLAAGPVAEPSFEIWDVHCHLYSISGHTPQERAGELIRGTKLAALVTPFATALAPFPIALPTLLNERPITPRGERQKARPLERGTGPSGRGRR